jgi:4-hydroxybenzoate polyprenyltransferase
MKNQLSSKFYNYLILIRPSSWLKNLFVFVPVIFSKHIFDSHSFVETLWAFFTFSVASGAVYVFNDILDAEQDKFHPLKRNRAVASGIITKKQASIFAAFLFLVTLYISTLLPLEFSLIVMGYICVNVLYSLFLKRQVLIDIFCIASGFILRVMGGAVIIGVHLSSWLILTTIFLSLFLAVMKRRVEIANSPNAQEQRTVLKEYSLSFIDQISSITAAGVILCYALYTVSDRTIIMFGTESLIFTTLLVIFGIFRYMFLVFKKNTGENIVETMIKDLPLLINSILYLAAALYIIYF